MGSHRPSGTLRVTILKPLIAAYDDTESMEFSEPVRCSGGLSSAPTNRRRHRVQPSSPQLVSTPNKIDSRLESVGIKTANHPGAYRKSVIDRKRSSSFGAIATKEPSSLRDEKPPTDSRTETISAASSPEISRVAWISLMSA